MAKRPLAILLGVTGNLAFGAGCVLQAVKRHSPDLAYDAFIYNDGGITPNDAALLEKLGARLAPFRSPLEDGAGNSFISTYSAMAFARFESLKLLRRYSQVLYLDIDIAVQGDIRPLLAYGPFGVTLEDNSFVAQKVLPKAGNNVSRPIPGLIADAPNINSGVFVVSDALPDPEGLYESYRKWLRLYADSLIMWDQALLNLMAHRLAAKDKDLVRHVPAEKYNTHPYSPNAASAVLLHAFGENKFWNDDLMRLFAPEWARDYAAWLEKGGAGWSGPARNTELARGGAYAMIWRFLAREKELEARLQEPQKP